MPLHCWNICRVTPTMNGNRSFGLRTRLDTLISCFSSSARACMDSSSTWTYVSSSPPLSSVRIFSASSACPFITSHRGDSTTHTPRRTCSVEKMAPTASSSLHSGSDPIGLPRICASRMPTTMANWFRVPREPRRLTGAISPRYRGTTTVDPPQLIPIRSRAMTNIITESERASKISTHVRNTPLSSMNRFLPIASSSGGARDDPINPPMQKMETIIAHEKSSTYSEAREFRMTNSGVLRTDVLYPKLIAPISTQNTTTASRGVHPWWAMTSGIRDSLSVPPSDIPSLRLSLETDREMARTCALMPWIAYRGTLMRIFFIGLRMSFMSFSLRTGRMLFFLASR
mmetsp:Transcript_1339/g.2538  ORF Transcript_1339/g.2538 Transcript_1339/m.2538 type:complete len:343 (+) Transcript_1339:927-1955(+)